MKKLFAVLCLALMLATTPALAAPKKKCSVVQKCKTHHAYQGHKVPIKKK